MMGSRQVAQGALFYEFSLVLGVAQRQRVADGRHDRQADGLRACFEVPERGTQGHPARLGDRSARLNQFSSDSAPAAH